MVLPLVLSAGAHPGIWATAIPTRDAAGSSARQGPCAAQGSTEHGSRGLQQPTSPGLLVGFWSLMHHGWSWVGRAVLPKR